MLKKIRAIFLRVAVSALSLGVVLYMARGEMTEGITRLAGLKWTPLLIALAINFASILVVTFRIRIVLAIQKIHMRFARLYYLWTISLFFNLFLPSAVGGDIAKAYYIAKDSGRKLESVTSVLIDRFFGLMATISIGFAAYFFGKHHIDDPKIGQLLCWAAGAVLIIMLLLVSRRFLTPGKYIAFKLAPKRFKERLDRFFEAVDLFRAHRVVFFGVYLYSLAAQAMFIILVYFLARSISVDVPLALFFLFLPLITVISMLPSVGGLGVREAAIVYLFRTQVPTDQAVAISLMFDLFLYGLGFACGILYAIRGGASIRELEEIET